MMHSIGAHATQKPVSVQLCSLQRLAGLPSISESDGESDDDKPNSVQLKFTQQIKRLRNTSDGNQVSSSKKRKLYNGGNQTIKFDIASDSRRRMAELPFKSQSTSVKENKALLHQKNQSLEHFDAYDENADTNTNEKARKKTARSEKKQISRDRKYLQTVDPYEAQHRKNIQKAGLDCVLRTSSSNSNGNIFNYMQYASPFHLEKKLLSKGVAAMAGVSRAQSVIVVKKGTNLILSDPKQEHGTGAGQYRVGKYLGGGSYGSVFSLRPLDNSMKNDFALKVETSVHHLPWEFHVLRKLQRRILGGPDAQKLSPNGLARRSAELNELIMFPRALITYRDMSCLLFPQASGNLCRIVGNAIVDSGGLSEVSAAYFISRMLRAIELTFSADILHGDIKLDNFVVFPDNDVESALPLRLTLIDWGRSIDRRDYGNGTSFLFNNFTLRAYGNDVKELVCGAQWHSHSKRSGDGPGWVHEHDLHALAVCVLRLLLPENSGDAILERHKRECFDGSSRGGTLRSAPAGLKLPRGWNELWGNLLGDLLHPHLGTDGSSRSSTFIRLLRTHRQSLEDFYEPKISKLIPELQRHLRRL